MKGPSGAGSAAHRAGEWPLVTAAEMQALDRRTIDELGVPGEVLMESAGRALVAPVIALRRGSPRPEDPVRALCGAGNNGGDGFVLVRHLLAEGIPAEAVLVGDPSRLPTDAALNWARLERAGASRRVVDPADAVFDWGSLLAQTSVAVDALFGTGLRREIEGGLVRVVQALNAAHAARLLVLAVDIPSGVSADTGGVLGCAVEADRTLTISLPKVGLALEPGAGLAGRIQVARVGIVDPDPSRTPRVELWNRRAAAARFPPRDRAGHKGRFGHVLVIAGSPGKSGAAALCSRAAARAGAGLVTLAYPSGLETELAALPAEVMSAPVASSAGGHFARAGEKAIDELVASRDVVALGPGIGTDAQTVELVHRLVARIDRPLVVDADGLNALRGSLELLHERSIEAVLTPHPGEAARLLETSAEQLNRDRIGAARKLAAAARSVVVLKGARTVVADAQGRALVTPTGGPALATGGTGDVLTGVVAALLAAGLDPFEAAGLAAWWHGAAADRMSASRVGFGLLASELADALPDAAAECLSGGMLVGEENDSDECLDLQFPGS